MKFSGEVIGDGDADVTEKYLRRSERLPQAMDKGAETIVNKSKSIATSKGLNKTGAGVDGIIYEPEGSDRLIGWDKRPKYHLAFHETGTYKDPARPHIRPAADQTEEAVVRQIEHDTVGD